MSEWSTTANMCTGMLSAWMKLYDPILGGVVKATRPPMAMPEQVNPNKANLASSLAQTTGHLSPNELTGMSLTWQQSIGQRIMRTHSYKFIGQGNPMMGKPGSGLETQLQWSGGKHTHLGPAYQLVVGPFNVHSMMKGKLDSQLVHVSSNSTNVYVNSWDMNTWAIFMAINSFTGKLGRHHHFKFKSHVQCPGGLIDGLKSGRSAAEFEAAYCPAMLFKRVDVSIGAKWGAELGLTLDHLKALPLSIVNADPFIVLKHSYPPFNEDKGLDSTNLVSLQYSRQQQKLTMELVSTPESNMEQMVEMNIKSPNFLKQLPKEARKEQFKWAFYERNSYKVRGEMDFKSKLFGYSLATNTKWIGFGSEFTCEVKADPGNLVPHKMTATLSDKLFIDKETIQSSPLTTDLSLSYDTATPERPPRFGVNFNLTM